MKNFKNLLFVALFFCVATVIGQTKISGTVVDEATEGLPGASVVIKGTTNGTQTDFDGKFTLTSSSNSGTIVISFVGYKTKEVSFSGSGSLGTIQLTEDGNILDEVVIKGIIENYPVKSPLDIKGLFDKTTYAVGGKKITLNDIEHKLLRAQFNNDPRFHFVLVCAGLGCPPIIAEAYMPNTLDAQLTRQTKIALNSDNFIKVPLNSVKPLNIRYDDFIYLFFCYKEKRNFFELPIPALNFKFFNCSCF